MNEERPNGETHPTSPSITELSKEGYKYVRANRLDEADACFTQILEIDPGNTYALVGLGDVARKRGAYGDAVDCYLECLEYQGDNNYALFGLADSYKALRQYDKAIEIWERYLGTDDANVTVLTRVADAYKKVSNFDRSKEIYLKALEVEPDNPYALIGLGYLHFDFKYFAEALQYWERVLHQEENRANIKILTAIGNCHRKLRTYEKGKEYFQQALELEHGNFYANFGMADCHRGLGEQDESLFYWRQILKADPRNKVILTRAGDSCRDLGRLDEAEDYYRGALNIGYDAYAVLGLAVISKERGNHAEAVESLEKLIKNDPKNARLHHTLAECYVTQGRRREAVELLRAFTRQGTRNPFVAELLRQLTDGDG